MPNKSPSVFVSSTCFDLAQIRVDIKIFLESLGLDPVMSEFDSFPVNPDEDTISNCMSAVDEHADIFVLVVGNRYGTKTAVGTSITNSEYLRAKTKGIPIYVFIIKDIISILPVWNKSHDADYSDIVDTPDLLKFADSIRSSGSNWVFPFENAQDIINTLRVQLSYLFGDALKARKLLNNNPLPKSLKNVPGNILQTAIEKLLGWEYVLFSEYLAYQITLFEDLRRDWENDIYLGKYVCIHDEDEFINHVSEKMSQAEPIGETIGIIINETFPKAVGEPGQPGNVDYIIYTAGKLSACYEYALKWSLGWIGIIPPDGAQDLIDAARHMLDDSILEIERFSNELEVSIRPALLNTTSNKPINMNFTLTLNISHEKEFYKELEKLKKKWGYN